MSNEEENTCAGPECTRPVVRIKLGLCMGHYQQVYLGKPLTPLRKKKSKYVGLACPVPECERWAESRGLCTPHASVAWRMSIHPDELPGVLQRPCAICGSHRFKAVDHDHACCDGNMSCGACIRGVLCAKCNVQVGVVESGRGLPSREVQKYLDTPPGLGRVKQYRPATTDSHRGRNRSR